MTRRLLCVLGLLLAGFSVARAQDAMSPPSDVLTFAPANESAWFTGEFLFGWVEGAHYSPLVTTTDPVTVDQSVAGVLGEPDTEILLSGTKSSGLLPGFRFGAGYIVDQENGLGVEAGFMYLANNSTNYLFDSADFGGILARPYQDATTTPIGDQASVLIGFPGLSTGTLDIESKVGDFYSLNLNMTEKILDDESGLRMDALFGYRFASFNDELRFTQHLDSVTMPGTSLDSFDSFKAKNTFNGLDFGLRTSYRWSDRLALNVLTKVAAGNMHRTVDIRGRTVTTVTGAPPPVTATGGMLALSSNIGEHSDSDWTVLPEAGANLVWKFRSNMNLRMGYSMIYLTKAARADDQIDFTLNPNLFPPATTPATPARPNYPGNFSDFWIQSLSLGVDVTF